VGLKTVFPGQPATSWAKDLGMTNAPASKPITAGTLAQWILNWEEDARAVKLVFNGKRMYPTTSAFGLLQLYSVFYDTNITSPQTVINQHDLQMVIKNLTDVGNGYRLLAPNKMELLLPLWGLNGNRSTFQPNYSQLWARSVKEVDSTTLTFTNNGVVYDRAHYAGMVMIRNFTLVNDGDTVWGDDNPGGLVKPSAQVSEKVPVKFIFTKKNVGHFLSGANSLNKNWVPYNGTYFEAQFFGPANLQTIANDLPGGKGPEEVAYSPLNYYVLLAHGIIKNVMQQDQMNSYPFQTMQG
jgi:hypothetical protein